MNKNELVALIAETSKITKSKAEAVLKASLNIITAELKKNGKITMAGLGTFTANIRNERKGRNPSTGKEILIPKTIVPGFKPTVGLKELINKEN